VLHGLGHGAVRHEEAEAEAQSGSCPERAKDS
jgi:hypothetical protein